MTHSSESPGTYDQQVSDLPDEGMEPVAETILQKVTATMTDEIIKRAETGFKTVDQWQGEIAALLRRAEKAEAELASVRQERDALLEALERNKPFGFDPATGFIQADDGGAGEHCVFYVPRDEAEAVRQKRDIFAKIMDESLDRAEDAEAERDSLAKQVAKLQEALKPFAERAARYSDDTAPDASITVWMRDLRRARAALQNKPASQGGAE